MMTAQCVTRDQLQEYLSGWTAPEQSEAIEAHLQECSACEQTAAELEGGSDIFLESVRRSQTHPQQPDAGSAELELAAALDRAKQVAEPVEMSDQPQHSDAALPIAPTDIGSYELLRPIGHGGMGSVYLARHRQLGKQLAIKLLSNRLNRNGAYTARFQREMRAAGGLDHPAIVRATDAGEHNGTHYLAMEYIEGLDLSRVARLLGKFSIADACEIARQVALGLSHAHAAGVTHRDIKPSNIMLSTAGQVKILDFGLARLNLWDEVSAELTTVGQLIGTLDYMAPEQADRPESVDYRADLYALGATLFRLLCGRPPLAASPEMSPLAKLRLLATHQPPSLAILRPDAPAGLVQLVASLLARDPESRPASAAHVAEELQRLAQGADLPALVSRAQTRAEKEPDEVSAIPSSHVLPDTRTLSPGGNELAAGAAKPPRRAQRLVAWAFAPLALLAGVLITLETQKGNLVIESEAANISVKLLRDGKPYDQLKIEPGATSTRVYAGQYEVTLDGGSDALLVEGGHIEIRRGETAIARIRQRPALAAVAEPKLDRAAEIASPQRGRPQVQASSAARTDEPLYDGKPLSYWLEMVGREKSIEGYEKALTALKAMVTPENGEAITSVLLPVLRSQPGIRRNAKGGDLDHTAFSIIKMAMPGAAYFRQLAKELESGSSVSPTRIFEVAHLGGYGPGTTAPLTEWLEKNVFAKGGRPDLLVQSADYYQKLIYLLVGSSSSGGETAQLYGEAAEHYAKVLLNCEALGDAYWLGKPSYAVTSSPNAYVPWYPALGNRIEERAIQVVGGPGADRKLVAHALLILSVLHSSRYDRAGLKDRRAELVDALGKAMKDWQANPASLYESQRVDLLFTAEAQTRYRTNFFRVFSPDLVEPPRSVHVAAPGHESTVWLSVAYVTLGKELGISSELTEELFWLFNETGKLNAELFAMLGGNVQIVLVWPDLRVTKPEDQRLRKVAAASREHWLAALLHYEAFQLLPEDTQSEMKTTAVRQQISSVVAEQMRQHDTDSDGQLSFEDAKPLVDDPKEVDTNGDERISAEELIEFRTHQALTPDPAVTDTTRQWSQQQISHYDQNEDGQLSADEWSRMPVKPDAADLDRDGFVSVEEYARWGLKNWAKIRAQSER